MTIPNGAIFKRQIIEQFPLKIPRMGAVLGWAQAATLVNGQSSAIPAKVYFDWWKLYENDTVIWEDTFAIDGPFTDGGIYVRNPKWFDNDTHTNIQTCAEVTNGILIIDAATNSSNIIHWWQSRQLAKQGCRYYIEARVKVEGDVALQFGLDNWLSLTALHNGITDPTGQTSNVCEAWVSDWIGDTGGEFVTVKYPSLSANQYTSGQGVLDIKEITVNGLQTPLSPFPPEAIKVVFDGFKYQVWVKGQEV